MRSRRKVQNRMNVLKQTGKKNILALALAIAMVSSTVAGEPLSIHAYADETNAISSSDDGSSKSSGKTEEVKEEKTSSKEEKTDAKTEKASEERSTGKSETSAAAKSAIKIVTEAENSAASDTKSSDVKIGFSENTEKSNASGQKSSGSSDNTSATSVTEKATEATNTDSSASGASSTEKATEAKANTSDAETKSSTASSDTNSSTENTANASNGANGSAAGAGASTGAAGETTAPETNAPETSATETTAAVETTAVETIAPETTAELDEEAQKKAESARIRKGILAADTAARKAKLGKTGSWKSSIFDFVKHLFYINVVADAENEADDVEDESISEMEVSEDDIDDYSVDLGKDYTANVVDDEDHVSGKNCFTSIIMARKVSGKWKAQSEFHDGDSVRVSLAVSIPSDAMDEDSRVFYYQLPSAVTISEEQSGLMKRDDIVIGKYVLTEDGMLVVKLTDNISVNQKFRGIIVFDAELSKADDQTMEKIDFGSYVFILHDGVSNDAKGGDAEDVDADVTDETEPTDTVQDDANKVATESEIDADGELNTRAGVLRVSNRIVTASANFPAETFPIGTKMQVVRVKKPSELKTLKTKVDEQLENENSGKIAKDIYAYDISFIYDGEKIEPLNPVDISLQFNKSQGKPKATKAEDPDKSEWKMFHATDETAHEEGNSADDSDYEEYPYSSDSTNSADDNVTGEVTTENLVTENSVLQDISTNAQVSTNSDNTTVHEVNFSSDAFSVYVLAYTVDFHYGDYVWSMKGEESVLLSELFEILGIEKNIADINDVTFSNSSLVKVENISTDEGVRDWKLISLQPFTSDETLTIYFADKTIITIQVTDEQEGSKPTLQGLYYTDSYDKWGTGYWRKLESNQKVTSNFYFRIQYGYSIPAGTLDKSETGNVITYKLDEKYRSLFKNGNYPALENGVIKDDQGKDAGTYEVIDGVARLSFYDEYVEKNRNSELKGMFSYTFAFADILTGTEKTITLPYADELDIKNIEKKADLTVLKEGKPDQTNETATYTITVSSKNGTFGDIVLKDTSSEIYIERGEAGTFTITKGGEVLQLNNKRGENEQNTFALSRNKDHHGFTLTLPPLAAGESYKITYSDKKKKKGQTYSSVTATNTIYGTTKDEDDKELKTDPSKVDLVYNKTSIGKYASSADNGEFILWTITIKNDSEQDLKGWRITDAYKLNDNSLTLTENDIYDVKIEPAVSGFGKDSVIRGFTFPRNSKAKVYTITYKTKAYEKLGKNHYHNDVTLTPSGNNGKSQDAGSDFWTDEFNPLHKEGIGVEASSDGSTATTHWKITVNADKGDISSNWVLTDVLKDNQYFTDVQLNDLKKALDQLNRNYSLKVSNNGSSDMVDFSKRGSNQKYNAYQITFRDSFTKGSSFSYEYTATAPLDGSGRQEFHNKANINQKVYDEGTNKFRNGDPTITKLDGRNDSKQDSDYKVNSSDFSENISWNDGESTGKSNHILKWKIKIYLNAFDDSDLQVVEHIPDDVILREVNFVTESNHGRGTTYLKINGGDANYSTYTIHTDRSGNVLIITFPKDFLENEAKIGTEKLKLEVYAEVDPSILEDLTNWNKTDGKNIYTKIFNNKVELKTNGQTIDTGEQKQTVIVDNDSDVIKKSITSKNENNRYKDNTISYEIKINPNGLDLLSGTDSLTLVDQMDAHYYPNQGQVNTYTLVNLLFFRLNADGTKGEALNCPYQISSNIIANGGDYQYIETFKATIPDETPILVSYSYKIDSSKLNSSQDWIQPLHNKAWLEGTVVDYNSESYSQGFNYVQGDATVEAEGVTLVKVNSENYGETISGTSFDLLKYDPDSENNEKYRKIGSYKTDLDGTIRLASLTKNWGYKLVETDAPSGYVLSEEPIYFYILSADTTAYPKNIEENRNYKIYSGGDRIYIENQPKDIPILLKKVGKSSKSPISGARFKLYGADGTTEVSDINLKESDTDGLITDTKGIILKPGTYFLDEIQAPNGYDLPKGKFKLVVSREEVDVYDFAEGVDSYPESGKHVFIPSDDIVTVEIENTAGIELPATGGSGTLWFYVLGSIMAIIAVGFYLQKHKEVSQK